MVFGILSLPKFSRFLFFTLSAFLKFFENFFISWDLLSRPWRSGKLCIEVSEEKEISQLFLSFRAFNFTPYFARRTLNGTHLCFTWDIVRQLLTCKLKDKHC